MSRLVLVSCESHGLVSWLMERLLEFLASDRTDCCCTGLQTLGRSVTLRSRSQTYNSMARPLNFKNLTFQIFSFVCWSARFTFCFFSVYVRLLPVFSFCIQTLVGALRAPTSTVLFLFSHFCLL